MSLNDLTTELAKTSVLDDSVQRKLLAAVLKLLNDKNSTIQNLAIKRSDFWEHLVLHGLSLTRVAITTV
jgi:hypothetical protein